MDPFDIFPAKVWEEILHRLKNPLDKFNLIRTNSSFELLELFQEKGAELHFHAVFRIVMDHLYGINENKWRSCQAVDVLNWRLVSKEGKENVDDFVKTFWNKFYTVPPFAFPICVNCWEHVEHCLEQAENLKNNSSPFIAGGLLYLDCREEFDFKQYLEQLTHLEMSTFLWKPQYSQNQLKFPCLKSLWLVNVPIDGWEMDIWEIIEGLSAPALQTLTLKSRTFDSLELSSLYPLFKRFVITIYGKIFWRRWNKNVTLHIYESQNGEDFFRTCVFSKTCSTKGK